MQEATLSRKQKYGLGELLAHISTARNEGEITYGAGGRANITLNRENDLDLVLGGLYDTVTQYFVGVTEGAFTQDGYEAQLIHFPKQDSTNINASWRTSLPRNTFVARMRKAESYIGSFAYGASGNAPAGILSVTHITATSSSSISIDFASDMTEEPLEGGPDRAGFTTSLTQLYASGQQGATSALSPVAANYFDPSQHTESGYIGLNLELQDQEVQGEVTAGHWLPGGNVYLGGTIAANNSQITKTGAQVALDITGKNFTAEASSEIGRNQHGPYGDFSFKMDLETAFR